MATKTKKKKYLETGTYVVVLWEDAVSEDEWKDTAETDLGPELIETVGIVFEHTSEKITIALNRDAANDCFSCKISIPTGMILPNGIRVLK